MKQRGDKLTIVVAIKSSHLRTDGYGVQYPKGDDSSSANELSVGVAIVLNIEYERVRTEALDRTIRDWTDIDESGRA